MQLVKFLEIALSTVLAVSSHYWLDVQQGIAANMESVAAAMGFRSIVSSNSFVDSFSGQKRQQEISY